MMRLSALAVMFAVMVPAVASGQTSEYLQKGMNGGSLENSQLYQWWDAADQQWRIILTRTSGEHYFELFGAADQGMDFSLSNSDTTVENNTSIGSMYFHGYDSDLGAEGKALAGIRAVASGEHTATNIPTDLVFETSSTLPTGREIWMRIKHTGEFSIRGLRTQYGTDPWYPNIIGGYLTQVGSNYDLSFIGNGTGHAVNGSWSFVGGGYDNDVSGNVSAIVGGNGNDISGAYAFVGGGKLNAVLSNYSLVNGGYGNSIAANSLYSLIAGGTGSTIGENSSYSTVGGGAANNLANGMLYSVISGGYYNQILGTSYGDYNVIAGGDTNTIIDSSYSFIGGGGDNNMYGDFAAVLGGYGNSVGSSGNYSLAAGFRSYTNYSGSFVWSSYDGGNGSCSTSASDQFMVCADGGAWFSHNVSALSFTDRPPYPQDLGTAYEAVLSMRRLPDGQYDPDDPSAQLDHESLSPFVTSVSEDGSVGRNLSATVSAQNEVIKNLVERIAILEFELAALKGMAR